MRAIIFRAALLSVFLLLVLAGLTGAQITNAVPVTYEVKEFSGGNISGEPLSSFTLQRDPDIMPEMTLEGAVDSVIDSLHIVLKVSGRQGSAPVNYTQTVRTDAELWIPKSGTVADSVFSLVFDHSRQLTAGEKFKLELRRNAARPTYAQIVTSTDTLGSAADTIYFPAISGGREHQAWLITATAAASDSCAFGVGYRIRDGTWWAGGAAGNITVIEDSVHVAPGETARITVSATPASNIQPVVYGRANTGHDVVVTRIKALSRD